MSSFPAKIDMNQPPKKPRKFRGFCAIDRRGALLWGTLRPTEAESRALFEKWNPAPSGYDHGAQIMPVELYL